MSLRASSCDQGPAGPASSPLPASLSIALARAIAPHNVVLAGGAVTPHDVIAQDDVVVPTPHHVVVEQVAPHNVVEIEIHVSRIGGRDQVLSPHDVVSP